MSSASFSFLSFFLSAFLTLLCISYRGFLSSARVLFPHEFLFLIRLSILMLYPMIGPFIFKALGFPSPVVAPGLVLCTRHLLSCRNSWLQHSCCIKWTFTCLVRCFALHLDSCMSRTYLCNQGGTASHFHSRLECHILNLAVKYGITHSSIHTYPSECRR